MFCIDVLGITLGTIGLLVGQVLPEQWGTLVQGGAFAVLAYAFLHLITRTLPQRDRDYVEAVARVTQRHEETVDRLAEQQMRSLTAMTEAVNQLRIHCARVQDLEQREREERSQ